MLLFKGSGGLLGLMLGLEIVNISIWKALGAFLGPRSVPRALQNRSWALSEAYKAFGAHWALKKILDFFLRFMKAPKG